VRPAVLLGIRRDEHGVRAKERYFSARTSDFLWAVGGQPSALWNLYAAVPVAAGPERSQRA
jgi:sulfate adenylyltransferase subunit 2